MPVTESPIVEAQPGARDTLRARLATLLVHPALGAARETVAAASGTLTLSDVTPAAKGFVLAAVARHVAPDVGRPLLVLTRDNESADRLARTASTFLAWLGGRADAVAALPAFDCSPYQGRSPHPEILERRALTLWNVARGHTRFVVAPLAAALGRFADASYYRSLALEVKPGDELILADFAEHLAGIGYEPSEPVNAPGQFSVRGGIVDVFPPEAEWPVRIEFFGDQVESLREFDPSSQRSRHATPAVLILPLSEVRRSRGLFQVLIRKLAAREAPLAHAEAEPAWAAEYSAPFPGWEFFAPLAEPRPNTLAALMAQAGQSAGKGSSAKPRPPATVWDEPLDRERDLITLQQDWTAGFDSVRDMSPPRPRPDEVFLTEAEFRASVGSGPHLGLKELGLETLAAPVGENPQDSSEAQAETPGPDAADLSPNGRMSSEAASEAASGIAAETAPDSGNDTPFPSQPAPRYHGSLKTWTDDIRARVEAGESVILALAASGRVERLHEILGDYKVPYTDATARAAASSAPGEGQTAGKLPLLIVRGDLDEGVLFPGAKLLIESESDVFGGFDWGRPGRRDKSSVISTFISDLSDLKVGDYVVHLDHGIALYQGLRQLEVEGKSRDFMLLTYQDEAKLYVPLERLDLVEKYRSGGDGVKPTLDRLGGVTWERTKTRVKKALRDMAQELLQIYAQRKTSGGVAYSPDTPWQKEFEEAFEFEETPDQLSALAEIKRDLESPEPMDRLLCGDVGYGKTELAMRAAFKVVQDGRQVAVLTPTTVLAFQHTNTFRKRMGSFPIRIEMLSRFRPPSEQKSVVAEVQAGRVDIVIGTHRLLSKDVAFHNLGLLIVDEEQRFGVAAKEKLKKLRANVDVLTLTATPIPRTLHMSLGGMRDLSVIETPPRGRLAIQTSVAPFNDALVQSAILQEMAREGQVYFVHNRVESIFAIAALVQRLVPTARIGVGHGQMGEKELERVMLKFVEYGYDVFVSTTIVENGLDIPRANTLIVNHAERFGLADLYQLRGRVGRSDRRAYAYLLIPAEDSLTPIARRRLTALKEFSDLGAGFRLAALDLELRGAGNVLGAEQSGHLNAIGLDLYLKMLEQTVEELKGNPAAPEVHTTLNLGLDIKIPDSYIADEMQRLRMYKRISGVASEAELAELEAELADRYGLLPAPVTTLLGYALLKAAAERLRVQSIERKNDEVWIRFDAQSPVDTEKLRQFMRRRREAVLRPDGSLRFRARAQDSALLAELHATLHELHASN
ncbi:MAG TPA: transcription-repair coupling factor [Terriglobia bacterium]|jgi:transcription-repair coupling factor (superfamily II helicase)|nr:transcription-repair coupling factor [Terriglobia bacterium]